MRARGRGAGAAGWADARPAGVAAPPFLHHLSAFLSVLEMKVSSPTRRPECASGFFFASTLPRFSLRPSPPLSLTAADFSSPSPRSASNPRVLFLFQSPCFLHRVSPSLPRFTLSLELYLSSPCRRHRSLLRLVDDVARCLRAVVLQFCLHAPWPPPPRSPSSLARSARGGRGLPAPERALCFCPGLFL